MRRLLAAALAATLVFGGMTATATPAAAASCRESSWIPQQSHFVLRSTDGRHTIHLQKGIQNRQQYIKVWLNSRYLGAEYLPATLLPGGQLSAIFRTKTVYETWMGSVRLVTKTVAVVRLCGANWVPVVFN